MSEKSQGILKWMISGNPVHGCKQKVTKSFFCVKMAGIHRNVPMHLKLKVNLQCTVIGMML